MIKSKVVKVELSCIIYVNEMSVTMMGSLQPSFLIFTHQIRRLGNFKIK